MNIKIWHIYLLSRDISLDIDQLIQCVVIHKMAAPVLVVADVCSPCDMSTQADWFKSTIAYGVIDYARRSQDGTTGWMDSSVHHKNGQIIYIREHCGVNSPNSVCTSQMAYRCIWTTSLLGCTPEVTQSPQKLPMYPQYTPQVILSESGQTDGRTDRQTGGRCNISRPGPSTPREIKSFSYVENINIFGYLGAWGGGGSFMVISRVSQYSGKYRIYAVYCKQ